MYTPNTIESLNNHYRKITKMKLIFPIDQRLQKILSLTTMKVTEKWIMRYSDKFKIVVKLLTTSHQDSLHIYINLFLKAFTS